MNKEKQRIAIAEACGWRWESRIKGAIKVWNKPPSMVFHDIELPDYLNDLNAMHEAALSLDIVSRRVFAEKLNSVCDEELAGNVLDDLFIIQNATAEQRAEALLRAIGKWEE